MRLGNTSFNRDANAFEFSLSKGMSLLVLVKLLSLSFFN